MTLLKVRIPHHGMCESVRQSHSHVWRDNRKIPRMDSVQIIAALNRLGVRHEDVAKVIGRDRTAATRMLNGERSMKAHEIPLLADLVKRMETDAGDLADLPSSLVKSYVEVEVLPTYAGMGGGGTGDGDRQVALMDRGLVEDELRATAADLLIVNVRGDSMEPIFLHGDQLVIDRRDRNPRQPGPFALWFDDGYVVKNVQVMRASGKLRVFSNNPKYEPDEADPDEVQIMGRPVWFSRQL